jgi:hypothetical protein
VVSPERRQLFVTPLASQVGRASRQILCLQAARMCRYRWMDPIFSIPDPASGVKKLLDPQQSSRPDPDLDYFYPSQIQGSKRHRISDPDPRYGQSRRMTLKKHTRQKQSDKEVRFHKKTFNTI